MSRMLNAVRHRFQTEQWVPYPGARVFAFFADPANLPPLMPRWQRARVEKANYVSPSTDVVAREGSLITISFRPVPLVPLRLEWDALIVEFRWNEFFCDEQRRGPFRYFHHCHRIREEVREGVSGTVVNDDLEYELPLGVLGNLANTVGVKRQIGSLFRYRQRMLPMLLSRG
jgi:ligand-binding SRPBCC domain-containing protein